MSKVFNLAEYHSLNKLLAGQRDQGARNRLRVIILSLHGEMTAAQIGQRLNLARSTVFAYRRRYAEQGVAGLLARTRRGRPGTPVTPALEQVIVEGLRRLSWFNIPALREWIRHHDKSYPEWTVRRWARALVKRLNIRFQKDWRDEMISSYAEWKRSINPLDCPYTRWRRLRAMRESTEPSLNLVIGKSAGLLPWHDFAA